MARITILEQSLQRLEEMLLREPLDTRDPDLIRMIEKLSAKAKSIRQKLNHVQTVYTPSAMAETKEATNLERCLDQLAVQFAQTHDEKIRSEILELAKNLPTRSN